jgi:hypothetical protein
VLFRIRSISDPSVIRTSAVIIILFSKPLRLPMQTRQFPASRVWHLCTLPNSSREGRSSTNKCTVLGILEGLQLHVWYLPFFWLCGRFVVSAYKKMPGIYRAGTNVLRTPQKTHRHKSAKTCEELLVQVRAASRASTHFSPTVNTCQIICQDREARKFRTDVEVLHKSMPTMCAGTWPFPG